MLSPPCAQPMVVYKVLLVVGILEQKDHMLHNGQLVHGQTIPAIFTQPLKAQGRQHMSCNDGDSAHYLCIQWESEMLAFLPS